MRKRLLISTAALCMIVLTLFAGGIGSPCMDNSECDPGLFCVNDVCSLYMGQICYQGCQPGEQWEYCNQCITGCLLQFTKKPLGNAGMCD